MSKKLIPYYADEEVAKRLYQDVQLNNFRVYDVEDFGAKYAFEKYPSGYLDKCSSVSVAISGSGPTGFLLIAPHRVDTSGSSFVHDLDPAVFAFSVESEEVINIGAIGYHQNFDQRTTLVPNASGSNHGDVIMQLRHDLQTGSYPLSACAAPVESALHYMAGKLQTIWIK